MQDTTRQHTEDHLSWDEALDRLVEFSKLPANWDEYDSDPISDLATSRAREVLTLLRDAFEPAVGEAFMPDNVVPMRDGGVQLEWSKDGMYVEVEIHPHGEMATLMAITNEDGRKRTKGTAASMSDVLHLVMLFLGVRSA